jgi:hypothetical protein
MSEELSMWISFYFTMRTTKHRICDGLIRYKDYAINSLRVIKYRDKTKGGTQSC